MSACRPVLSIASRVSPVAARSLPSAIRSAPAWTTITLTLCERMSCNSRAIRALSSAAAARALADTFSVECSRPFLHDPCVDLALANRATRQPRAAEDDDGKEEVIDPHPDESGAEADGPAGERGSAVAMRGHAVDGKQPTDERQRLESEPNRLQATRTRGLPSRPQQPGAAPVCARQAAASSAGRRTRRSLWRP